jgi:hypothetical protein
LLADAFGALQTGEPAAAAEMLADLFVAPPFSQTLIKAVVRATKTIIRLERERGEIARSERSELCDGAKPYQEFIDSVLFRMAGLNERESKGLQTRLSTML